ncbi:MAG: transcription termination/antitermination protein NusA [Clostridiales bacterium]|nr:transcription termination/antitermination protein NusA [Clostridiales bacterium]
MVNKGFFEALDALEQEKGISKEYFMDALQTALTTAYKRNFNEVRPVEVAIDPAKYSIDIYAYQTIVSEVENPDEQISLVDAKQIKKTAKLGDKIKTKFSPKDFARIAASIAKQVITQKLREKEKDSAYGEFSSKVGTLMTGIVSRVDAGNVYIEFPGTNTEGVMSEYDQIATEKYQNGDRIKVYVKKLRETNYGVQAICSRSNADFVRKLFELEVPEIQDGVVEIVNVVREVGYRTKIAINSKDPNVDALGACVGAKGVRVNSIVFQLGGEKIDIIVWSDDPFEYIARALSPAKVISVEIDEITKSARVIVPDDKLSLAIGKGGQNVRLAAKLTNWKIDVKSESKAREDSVVDVSHTDVDDIGGIFSGTEDISLD